ncbi:MAG: hypothetical protein AAF004_05910 [Pseudomonadota bacterium]
MNPVRPLSKALLLSTIVLLQPFVATASQPTGNDASQTNAEQRQAILIFMDAVFAAVTSSKPDDWRALQLADGTALSFRPGADEDTTELEMRMTSNEAFIANIAPDGHEYIERWTSEPVVLIHGPVAAVCGKYGFWIDGEFSHCGIDLIDLVRVDDEWKIANFTWTVEREQCAVTDLANAIPLSADANRKN